MTHSGFVPDTHAEAWALLPFLANGRISAEDREWVELHVHSCHACREEFAAQQSLEQHLRTAQPPFAGSEQRAFAKLWTRIEASETALPPQPERRVNSGGSAPRRTVRWLAAAVVVQAIGLALLGVTALNTGNTSPGEFRTVTSNQTHTMGPAIRVVFRPDASMADVSDLLSRHELELIGGPQGSGIFTASSKDSSSDRSMESLAIALRNDARVLFAEPIVP
jgi:anti-sigma factor RsiW